jgi:hypothetical protein
VTPKEPKLFEVVRLPFLYDDCTLTYLQTFRAIIQSITNGPSQSQRRSSVLTINNLLEPHGLPLVQRPDFERDEDNQVVYESVIDDNEDNEDDEDNEDEQDDEIERSHLS